MIKMNAKKGIYTSESLKLAVLWLLEQPCSRWNSKTAVGHCATTVGAARGRNAARECDAARER